MTAIAVREHGTEKFNNVIRFLYSTPPLLSRAIECWIAITRYNLEDRQILFNSGSDVQNQLRSIMEPDFIKKKLQC